MSENAPPQLGVHLFVMPLLYGIAAACLLLVFGLPILFVVWLWSWCPPLAIIVGITGALMWCDADEYLDMPSHV